MERQISVDQAWPDFWAWVKTQPTWNTLERKEKQYLGKADIDHRAGRLGPQRTKNLLQRYAPDRYEFAEIVIIHE